MSRARLLPFPHVNNDTILSLKKLANVLRILIFEKTYCLVKDPLMDKEQ